MGVNSGWEWNKRGYGAKKFRVGGKEFRGGVEDGSRVVEYLENRG